MELFIFDINLNRLGIIDDYKKLSIRHNYFDHSKLELTIDATPKIIELLKTDEDRIFVSRERINEGYFIETFEYLDEKKSEISILAYSSSILLNRRTVPRQQTYSGNIEDAFKYFVTQNCISPVNQNRKMKNLINSSNNGVNIIVNESLNGGLLDEGLWELCKKHDVSYRVLLDHKNKKFLFDVFQGVDRSTEQELNDQVIFAKEFDNVISQSYVDDKSNFKNVAIVAGEGEGYDRVLLTINDEASGYDRREVFIDARDLQRTSQTENEDGSTTETIMPEDEYNVLLEERGKSKLTDYERVQSFETDIDTQSQFLYRRDYELGDKVSIKNTQLSVIMHTRMIIIEEVYERKGYELRTEFGSAVPTLIDKLKRVK